MGQKVKSRHSPLQGLETHTAEGGVEFECGVSKICRWAGQGSGQGAPPVCSLSFLPLTSSLPYSPCTVALFHRFNHWLVVLKFGRNGTVDTVQQPGRCPYTTEIKQKDNYPEQASPLR